MSAIVVRELSKKYRKNVVLDGVNLEVFDGEIFSLMGLKDSGKTTLARILFKFLKPTAGSVSIFDMDAQKEDRSVKEFTGYVPEDVWIYDNLKPMAIFKTTLGFHGLKNTDEIQSLMDYFELDNRHKFVDLTDSQRKRVAIINALIPKPKLIVIDDPTKDLSPPMIEKLFTHLKRLQQAEGLSVLLLTDNLSVGQRYGDRGAYLADGRIVGMEYLKEKYTNDKVLRIFDEVISVRAFEEIGARLIRDEAGNVEFFYDGYLPTLTTVLHQEKVKNYILEDALLENKIDAFESGYDGTSASYAPDTTVTFDRANVAGVSTEGEEDTILAYDKDELEIAERGDDAITAPYAPAAPRDALDPAEEVTPIETQSDEPIAFQKTPDEGTLPAPEEGEAADGAIEVEAPEDTEKIRPADDYGRINPSKYNFDIGKEEE